MKTSNRFFSQAFFWLGVWLLLWVEEGSHPGFIVENGLIFLFQICLIAGIIYYAAPKLLFKKQPFLFFCVLVLAIAVFMLLGDGIFKMIRPPHPSHIPPPFRKGPGLPLKPIVVHFLFLVIASLITIFIETLLFAQKKEKETILNKNEMLQTELKLLKFQINPHFLFNTLNNIYTLSVIDSDKTQQSIAYLSTMLRYVLYDCEQEYVQIHQEVAYIENYLQLFSLKSIEPYPITIEKSIDNPTTQIAPMLLIPFIENALKHSYIEKRGVSFIKINIVVEREYVRFEIENSKPINAINKDGVGGIGLENVKKRLAILYPEKHLLDIKEDSATFKVNLIISGDEKS